jgi:uncharacterized protein (DUF58 family)
MASTTRKYSSAKIQVLVSFAAISFALGLFFRDALIYAGIPVVLYLVLVSLQSDDILGPISISRTVEKLQFYEEDSTKVRLRTTNLGKRSVAFVTVEDRVPTELLGGASSAVFSFSLKPGEIRDCFYLVKADIFGLYNLGPIKTRCEDAPGRNFVTASFNETTSIVVLPKTTERLAHFKISPRKTKPWPGEIVARRVGLGMDNYSIRQYLPGDSYRRINWRASAKSPSEDDLLLNEQTAELGADTIIIVDARPASNLVSPDGQSLIKNSLRAAISLSDKLLRDRNRVGLVTIGLETSRIPPGYGRRQYNRLVLSLIKVRAGGLFTFENIPSYMKYFYPHLAQVIMVSPLLDSEAFTASSEIARSGYELLVLSPNPLDYSSAFPGWREKDKRIFNISRELASIVRQNSLSQIRESGAIVLDWRKDESLDFALAKNIRAHARAANLAARRSGYR